VEQGDTANSQVQVSGAKDEIRNAHHPNRCQNSYRSRKAAGCLQIKERAAWNSTYLKVSHQGVCLNVHYAK